MNKLRIEWLLWAQLLSSLAWNSRDETENRHCETWVTRKTEEKETLFPRLECWWATIRPMKLFCGDAFLFRGVKLRRVPHELLSQNTVKPETEDNVWKWVSVAFLFMTGRYSSFLLFDVFTVTCLVLYSFSSIVCGRDFIWPCSLTYV